MLGLALRTAGQCGAAAPATYHAGVTPDRPKTAARDVDILLVEDDAALVRLIVRALHARGLTTDVVGDSTEATRLLSRSEYKVVVVDIVPAAAAGFEVIDFIKSSGATMTHVVAVTACGPSALDRIDRSVAKTLFFKPLNIEHFSSYVQTLAGRR